MLLAPNDTIEFIAPASKFDPEILKKVSHLMQDWGLKAKISCPMSKAEWLCTTDEKERFDILQNALENPLVKAIWVVWGGYGCSHLVPYLDRLSVPSHPKLLMGFSDTTILHVFVNKKWQWPSLHCPSAHQIALHKVSRESIEALKELIVGSQMPYFLNVRAMNDLLSENMHGLTARMVGGNLSLVVSSLGTPWQIETEGKFLFLEEIGEAAYRIDRMFHQLLQAGIFHEIKGLLLGEFIQRETQAMDDQTQRLLDQWAHKLAVPVLSCKAGHGISNYPVPLNCQMQVELSPQLRLKFSL